MKAPILDGFYDSRCFLTAQLSIGEKLAFAKEYIKEHKIKTAILVFNRALEQNPDFLPERVKIGELQAGEDLHGLYAYNDVLLTVPFVGNANASGTIEELAHLGIKNILCAGSAGLIDQSFDDEKMLVVERAIRDEGGSYHYAPPETYTYTDEKITKAIEKTFDKLGVNYEVGTTWTFDSFYKESEERIKKRLSEGATSVEMECATFCVVAKHLGVHFGQFLFFSDTVCDAVWAMKGTKEHRLGIKNKITLLCLEIAKNIR